MKHFSTARRFVFTALALSAMQPMHANAQQQTPEQAWQALMQWQQPPATEEEKGNLRVLAEGYTLSLKNQTENAAVTAYALSNLQAHTSLRLQAYKLRGTLLYDFVPDEQVGMMLDDLRASLAKEKQRRADALQQLDAQIGFSKKPRLEKFLLLSGELGDENAIVNTIPKALYRTKIEFSAPADSLAQVLSSVRVTDTKTRDAITQYATDYETSVSPLIDQAETINLVESDFAWAERLEANVPANEDGLHQLSERFRTSVANFKAQRTEKLRALDEQIGYSINPRLNAALDLLGITDDDMRLIDLPDSSAALGYKRFRNPITGEDQRPKGVFDAWLQKMAAENRALAAEGEQPKAALPK